MSEPRGAGLAAAYWHDVVQPLLERRLPGLPLAAGLLGPGSEVLGLDDGTSRDHDWGLRLTLLVPADGLGSVRAVLAELPETFAGLPTRFATTRDQTVAHRIEVADPEVFAAERLGIDPSVQWTPADWLTLTGQAVLEVTSGPIFHDTDGRITRIRDALAWYPGDLWLHVVACDWQRIDQELPFVGRAGDRGDEIGSRVITARLVRIAMHLGFLLERRWPPYSKWVGSMFQRLPRARAAGPALGMAMSAETWQAREDAFCTALDMLLDLQRTVGLPAVESATQPFFDRPFRCISPELVPLVLRRVEDPAVRSLPLGVGAIEQWVDNVDVLARSERRRAATATLNARSERGPVDPV